MADDIIDDDFVDHNPLPGLEPNKKAFKKSFAVFHMSFPDLAYNIEDIIAEGDKVVVRRTATGTHKGDLFGIPATGKMIEVVGVDVFRVKDGKFKEFWLSWDQMGMMQQLGVV